MMMTLGDSDTVLLAEGGEGLWLVHTGRLSKAGIEREKKKKKITPNSKPFPEKPSVAQFVYKFHAISETRRVITVLKSALQVLPLLVQMNPVHPLPHYFFNNYFNIILSRSKIFQISQHKLLSIWIFSHASHMPRPSNPSYFDYGEAM